MSKGFMLLVVNLFLLPLALGISIMSLDSPATPQYVGYLTFWGFLLVPNIIILSLILIFSSKKPDKELSILLLKIILVLPVIGFLGYYDFYGIAAIVIIIIIVWIFCREKPKKDDKKPEGEQ